MNTTLDTPHPSSQPTCLCHTWVDHKWSKRQISEREALGIDPSTYNIFLDIVHNRYRVKPQNGKLREIDPRLPGVLGQPFSLLLKLVRFPGLFMSPHDIGKMPPENDSHYIKDNIIQYVAKLRKHLFSESAADARFILTSVKPYRVAISADITMCVIEPSVETEE